LSVTSPGGNTYNTVRARLSAQRCSWSTALPAKSRIVKEGQAQLVHPLLVRSSPYCRQELGHDAAPQSATAGQRYEPHRDGVWTPFTLAQPFRSETLALCDALLTRQAVKNLLHYLQETNGEAHLWLTNYCAANGAPPVDSQNGAQAWLARLAAQPVVVLQDPLRAMTVKREDELPEFLREVSPRDIAERLLALRLDIADEVRVSLEKVSTANSAILLKTLSITMSESPPLED
jgi:hypothetical protein